MSSAINTELHEKVNRLNDLLREIRQYKDAHPESKDGYNPRSVGSLLNAYREADIDFEDCVQLLSRQHECLSSCAHTADVAALQAAIRKHRDQRGDDRCWKDDEELYAVLPEGYTPPERDGAVELKNCERFIASRQNPKTEYVSPERMAWDEAERILTELEFGDPVTKGIAVARFRKAKGDPDPVIPPFDI
jgi:hypothetical protein